MKKTAVKPNGQSTQMSSPALDDLMVRLGKEVPVQMVLALQEDLFNKAMDWLRALQAPEEVISAFNCADYLQLIAGKMDAGKLDEFTASDLPASLIEAANLTVKFGGDFLGAWYCGEAKIPALALQSVSTETIKS